MRYLVQARVKSGSEEGLMRAIDDGTLGSGSVAEGEYLRNMKEARSGADGVVRWACRACASCSAGTAAMARAGAQRAQDTAPSAVDWA